jgi:alpha-N-arabinofuranosidase
MIFGGSSSSVRYWSIGNENWGAHEIGARGQDQWGPLVSRSAELMRAAVELIGGRSRH